MTNKECIQQAQRSTVFDRTNFETWACVLPSITAERRGSLTHVQQYIPLLCGTFCHVLLKKKRNLLLVGSYELVSITLFSRLGFQYIYSESKQTRTIEQKKWVQNTTDEPNKTHQCGAQQSRSSTELTEAVQFKKKKKCPTIYQARQVLKKKNLNKF